MTDGENEGKKRAVRFLLLMIAISTGIVAWVFLINLGAVEIEGDPPFTVRLGRIDRHCPNSPCRIKIAPGTQSFAVEKEGYFDFEGTTEVRLWRTARQTVSLSLIPKIEEIGPFSAPQGLKGSDSNFEELGPQFDWSAVDFAKFPKPSAFIVFSPSTKRAFVIAERQYLYDGSGEVAVLKPLDMEDFSAHDWLSDDVFFALSSPSDDSAQMLRKFDFSQSTEAMTVANFERRLEDPEMFAFETGVFIVEWLDMSAGTKRVYFVDFESKLKTRLDDLSGAGNFHKISGSLLGFRKDGKVFVRDVAAKKDFEIPAMSTGSIAVFEKTIVFGKWKESGSSGVTIEDFIELTETGIDRVGNGNPVARTAAIEFFEENLESGGRRKVAEFEFNFRPESEAIRLFPLSAEDGDIFFSMVKNGLGTAFAVRRR